MPCHSDDSTLSGPLFCGIHCHKFRGHYKRHCSGSNLCGRAQLLLFYGFKYSRLGHPFRHVAFTIQTITIQTHSRRSRLHAASRNMRRGIRHERQGKHRLRRRLLPLSALVMSICRANWLLRSVLAPSSTVMHINYAYGLCVLSFTRAR